MIIDTHCHLDDEKFDLDLDQILNSAYSDGIDKIVIPGASIKDLPKAVRIAHENKIVYFAVGVHPYEISDYSRSVLLNYINDPKCVAVGECGLDYYRFDGEVDKCKADQKACFEDQINLACEFNKPLIVHCRDANEDMYNTLKNTNLTGVLHCYNASELLLKLSDRFYYGIGGVLTFKNAKKLVEILPKIPLDRILIETDGPYLSPEPNRGKRNEPKWTKIIANKIAEILNLSVDEIEKITTQNANELFKFKE